MEPFLFIIKMALNNYLICLHLHKNVNWIHLNETKIKAYTIKPSVIMPEMTDYVINKTIPV